MGIKIDKCVDFEYEVYSCDPDQVILCLSCGSVYMTDRYDKEWFKFKLDTSFRMKVKDKEFGEKYDQKES